MSNILLFIVLYDKTLYYNIYDSVGSNSSVRIERVEIL